MSTPSVAHFYAQEQQPSLLRNDELKVLPVKGMTTMTHKRNLYCYAESLVSDYAKHNGDTYQLFLCDLPQDEQGELARLYLETIDRELTECVHGQDFSSDNEYTCALLELLKEDSIENRERFAEITRKNVITYYEPTLQIILDEACNDHLYSTHEGHSLYPRKHQSNGQVYWSRY